MSAAALPLDAPAIAVAPHGLDAGIYAPLPKRGTRRKKIMLTLKQIRDQSPCKDGWTELQKSLGNPPMNTVISLGDIAKSNGAADAWWSVRALDWSNAQVQREVVKALMPSVERAAKHTTDRRVHNCIAVIHDWLNGKSADLNASSLAAASTASTASTAGAADAAASAAAAEWAAEAAASAAKAAWAGRAARAAEAAASAAKAAWAASAAWAAEAEELEAQRADLIAAFPPLVLT